jgi:hypothetical protein
MDQLHFKSAADIARLIRERKISATDISSPASRSTIPSSTQSYGSMRNGRGNARKDSIMEASHRHRSSLSRNAASALPRSIRSEACRASRSSKQIEPAQSMFRGLMRLAPVCRNHAQQLAGSWISGVDWTARMFDRRYSSRSAVPAMESQVAISGTITRHPAWSAMPQVLPESM